MMTQTGTHRRIQKTGGSTYIVSLPKKWVERRLKKGDALFIQEFGNRLVLSAQAPSDRKPLRTAYTGKSAELIRQVIASYLDGADRFIIQAKPSERTEVKRAIQEALAGIETVQETDREIVMQNLLTHANVSFAATLSRLCFLCQGMLAHLQAQLATGKEHDVQSAEAEVDRFYILAFRQLRLWPHDDVDTHRLSEYYVMAIKSLEKIADHALILSKNPPAAKSAAAKKMAAELSFVSARVREATDALQKKDAAAAETLLQKTEAHGINSHTDDFQAYNLRRILDYATDIAEMTLDMAAAQAR